MVCHYSSKSGVVHYIQRFSGLGEMWLLILHSKTSNDDEKPQVVVDEPLRNR